MSREILHVDKNGQISLTCPFCGKNKTIDVPAGNAIAFKCCGKVTRAIINKRKGLGRKIFETTGFINGRPVRIRDISLGGVSFDSKSSFQLGSVLKIAFALLRKQGDVEITERIKIISVSGILHGAEFVDLHDGSSAKKAIWSYLTD